MSQLMLMVQIAGRRCALCAEEVKWVIDLGTIAPVPRAPAFIAGITALRSQPLTVIDCRRALGLASEPWPCDSRAPVVAIGGHFYALMVDGIEDITTALGEPGAVPGGFGAQWSRAAEGMVETSIGPALRINLAALIAGPDGVSGKFAGAA